MNDTSKNEENYNEKIPKYRGFKSFFKALVQGKDQEVSSKRFQGVWLGSVAGALAIAVVIAAIYLGKLEVAATIIKTLVYGTLGLLGAGIAEGWIKKS